MHVLAAPREPSEADRIHPPDVTRIIEAVRKQFDYVVVDTPPQLNEIVLAAFDLSDKLYVMATLDLPSVRNMSVFLSTLERLKVPSDNVKLILNKAETDVGIDIDQVTRLFPQGFESVLPVRQGGQPVDQPRHAGDGGVAAGRDQPAHGVRHALAPPARAPVEAHRPNPRRDEEGPVPAPPAGRRARRHHDEALREARRPRGGGEARGRRSRRRPPPAGTRRTRSAAPSAGAARGSWDATKRKVRELVLEEVAPQDAGPHRRRSSPTR